MRTILKRAAAYMIDIILVSLLSTLLTSNSFINKDYDKYIETYDKYEENYENYIESLEELDEKLEDEEITNKEYDKKIDKITKQYKIKNEDYNYKLVKLSIIPMGFSIVIVLLYFAILQYFFNGQTIGKKILKLQIKSNNNKNLNIFNYILRCLILNEVLINIFSTIFIFILNKDGYIVFNNIIYIISNILEMLIVFMMYFDKNHRGLHDYIANTKVIDLKEEEVVLDEV